MPARLRSVALGVILLLLPGAAAQAAIVGQVDSFQNLATAGWFVGGGPGGGGAPQPQVQATGGPAGTGDAFLQFSAAGGQGPGSRLVGMNDAQWAGDYTTAGITGLSVDLRNFGAEDLAIRLELNPGSATGWAVTTASVFLPAGSGWMAATFALSAADLTALAGSASDALDSLAMLRIIHAPTAAISSNGFAVPVPVTGLLGVDNILALGRDDGANGGGGFTPVPEPAGLLVLAAGLAGLGLARRPRAGRGGPGPDRGNG